MVVVTLGNTIGAALLGTVAASVLYGIIVVQAYLYYRNFSADPLYQRISVAILILLSSLHVAFNVLTVYQYLISDFGNIAAVGLVSWSFKVQITFNTLMILGVDSLYAVRVWKLGSKVNKLWPCFVVLVLLGGFVPGFDIIVKVYALESFAQTPTIATLLDATYGYATAFDFMMAFTMCYYLHRGRSIFSSTNNIILKITQYVLVCGFLTSACSLSCLITLHTMPNTLVFIAIDFILPKLYVNSYLSLLNSRDLLRDKEGHFNVRKMISASGDSRMDRTQISCGTLDNGSHANVISLVDHPKIDITVDIHRS